MTQAGLEDYNFSPTIIEANLSKLQKLKNIEIIDNDINQNLLIGVPEYYIECVGYKNNISNDLINYLDYNSTINCSFIFSGI